MITKFKAFDEGDPEIGDYVIINVNGRNKEYYKIINYSIGKILSYGFAKYYVEFNIENRQYYKTDTIQVKRENIIHFSSDKRDLEIILNANKYNL